MNSVVFKVSTTTDWNEAIRRGLYAGSADDARDGYVHLSAPPQLAGTLEKHFKGQTGLVLVAFDAQGLGPELRWEKSRGGDLFPHFYGALPTNACLWSRTLHQDAQGAFVLDQDWLRC